LKYFNKQSKRVDRYCEVSDSERKSLASLKSQPENNLTMLQNFMNKEASTKPPRSIKIKPTQNSQMPENSFNLIDSEI